MATFMARIADAILQLTRDDSGQGLTEYALILAVIAIAAMGALMVLGGDVTSQLSTVASSV
jgi:pilus assembly protein Flp/PilA